MGNVKQETISGVKWGLLQKITLQPVMFLFGVVLARVISPREFGILGLTAVFFAVANTLKDAGFGTALIRKQDRTEADCSTMFWFNLGMSAALAGILFLLAPWFVEFYGEPDLLWLTRISALMMFLSSTGSVHWTLYNARRDFKTPAIVGIVVALIGIPICLYFAFNGWGIWAIVIQQVVTSLISLIAIWILSPWRPKLIWSNQSFREMFSFGVKLSVTGILYTLYREMRAFIIGKFYSPADLGLYNKGTSLGSTLINTVTSVIDPVIFPIFASIQSDNEKLLRVYKTYISLVALPMLFALTTFAANSENIILTLYGPNWADSAIYAQILCFGLMCDPLSVINSKIYLVKGRTDLTLKQEVFMRCFGVPAILIGAYISIQGICYASLATSLFSLVLTSFTSSKLSGIPIVTIFLLYFRYLAYSLIANIPSIFINAMGLPPALSLLINAFFAVVIYVFIMWLRKDKIAETLWQHFSAKWLKAKA